jgi:hypothetical protein
VRRKSNKTRMAEEIRYAAQKLVALDVVLRRLAVRGLR